MNTRKFLIVPILAVMAFIATGCAASNGESTQEPTVSRTKSVSQAEASKPILNPVDGISHAHGLAVDAADSSKLYIATHHGLLVLEDDKDLYRIGDIQDDFMGFSAHPRRPNIFFTSGHPQRGGNLGVQRSDDGGMSWTKLSDGVSGPVDFHSMTLSAANPSLMYGWYGALQRSADAGKNWELVRTSLSQVISVTADPHDENVVYAGTQGGLQISRDKGETWSSFSEQLSGEPVTAVAVDPVNDQNMLSFVASQGVLRSNDGGQIWESVSNDLGIVLYFAYDFRSPNTVYALNKGNSIYKSIDGGSNWVLIR